jgi:hypothetical protein
MRHARRRCFQMSCQEQRRWNSIVRASDLLFRLRKSNGFGKLPQVTGRTLRVAQFRPLDRRAVDERRERGARRAAGVLAHHDQEE